MAAVVSATALLLAGAIGAASAASSATAMTSEAAAPSDPVPARLAPPRVAAPQGPAKVPTQEGTGGAVATVDADATAAGLLVLRRGGNAVDAVVAAAAALGVTEPFSAGIGGGGFLVHYDATTGRVATLDGRETAPAAMGPGSFTEDGTPIAFADAVSSGLSVGVPGTPLMWQRALQRWGSMPLAQVLRPAVRLAYRGFVVDQTFHDQAAANAARFADFSSTAAVYLPGGQPPPVGTVFRNPDLARTMTMIGRRGVGVLYGGSLGREVVATVRRPPVAPGVTRTVRTGLLTTADLAAYTTPLRPPTVSRFRGLDLYGMGVPSSGGIAVAETLGILDGVDVAAAGTVGALQAWLEASALAFADRNRYVGDVPGVPVSSLLSASYAAQRRCLVSLTATAPKPVAPGDPGDSSPGCAAVTAATTEPVGGDSTTHVTTADRWGNIASYTFSIESTGGSGIVVPGRGFLLNNELTDFDFVPVTPGLPDPNLPGPGKRPRSSMSPCIVLRDGTPVLAVGSPGGATIITTVSQVLVNRYALGMTLPEAIAAPRASQRNASTTPAEPAFIDQYGAALTALGQQLSPIPEIGAATAIEFGPGGRMLAAAEPLRRGGGSAAVVRPRVPSS